MNGIVTKSSADGVAITLTCPSACAHCEAHSRCGFSESQEKQIVVIDPAWQTFSCGDTVEVTLKESQGLKAVFIAYLLPSILGLLFFFLVYNRWGELISALSTLAFFALYALALRLVRPLTQHQFSYTITKQ